MVTVVLTVLGAELDRCPRCDALEESLEYERKNNAYLLSIITRRPMVEEDVSEPEQFLPIRPRRAPWSQRRSEMEKKYKVHEDQRPVELTEGEKLFEAELKKEKTNAS